MTHNGKIKAGILGAGGISEFHIKGLRRLADVEIVGVADFNQSRASELAERFAVPRTFTSLATMLEARPDVVHVLTPPDAHAENTIEALRGGCHVLVEKPLATSVEDCDAIAAAAAEAGKSVCVGHSLLRDPFVARALEIARSGAIGDVVGVDHFRGQFYAPYAGGPMPYQFRDGGFPFRDLGVHSLYILEALLGRIEDATLRLGPPSRDGLPSLQGLARAGAVQARHGTDLYLLEREAAAGCARRPRNPRGDPRGHHGHVGHHAKERPPAGARRADSEQRRRGPADDDPGDGQRIEGAPPASCAYHGLQMLVERVPTQSLREDLPPPVSIDDAR